jgi:ubiquinone biosynthesis protein
VLVTLEGTTRLLSAKFSLMELIQPMHRQMVLRRLSPARAAKKLRRLFVELEHLSEVLPQRVMQILEQVQSGKFDVHLDHRGLGPSVNRLVLGMLASALFMGSSFMLAHQVPPFVMHIPYVSDWLGLEKISLLGLSGCSLSLLVGLRLLRAIGKSGHLDQKVSK